MTMITHMIPEVSASRPSGLALDPQQPRLASPANPALPGSFKDFLMASVTEVQRLQGEADMSVKQVVSGEVKDETMAVIAVDKADIAFQTLLAVRNKVVSAYEEVMRMQV